MTFNGDMRVIGCSSGCCRRWFITINGKRGLRRMYNRIRPRILDNVMKAVWTYSSSTRVFKKIQKNIHIKGNDTIDKKNYACAFNTQCYVARFL